MRNKLLISFAHALGGNTLMTIAQGLQFFILARTLGPNDLGLVATAGGITAVLVPFSGAGAANVMLMRSARDLTLLPTYLGNAFAVMLVTATLLTAVTVLSIDMILGRDFPFLLLLLFSISELLLFKVVDICAHAYMARDQVHITSRVFALYSAMRFVTAALFAVVVAQPTAVEWSWWALSGNLIVGAAVLHYTLRDIGPLSFRARLAMRELGTGLSFAIGLSARAFHTDADKVLLARYTTPDVVGEYTMAFRIVQIALTPIRALSMTLQARMYKAGESGLAGSLTVTRQVLRPLLLGAALLAVGFYVTAPLLTWIVGTRYAGSVDVLRALSLLPLLLALQSVINDTLATSGHQKMAASSQIASAVAVLVLGVVLIPRYGWQGAVLASYVSQAALVVLMLLTVYRQLRLVTPGRGADEVGGTVSLQDKD